MPDVIKVQKGVSITTKDGTWIVPEDTNLWSQGAYEKQLERAVRVR